MVARSRGNGTNFDWLRKSCGISTCDLSPNGNPEEYGMPMKSAIPKVIDWSQNDRFSRLKYDIAVLKQITLKNDALPIPSFYSSYSWFLVLNCANK